MVINTIGDIKMPAIGFGTWQVPSDDAADLVAKAIALGYNHIDCAHIYNNQNEIGKTLGAHKNRKELFVTSKLWSDFHEPDKVKAACEKTLKELHLNYLDLYLIHTPCRTESGFTPLWYKKEWIIETWREMVKLMDSGLCKSVGVSNFTTTKLKWVMEDGHAPSCNQVELQPYLPQRKLVDFCQENNIVVTAYSPLGSPSTPINMPSIAIPGGPVLLQDPVINEIAKSHNLTPAQVVLAWGINRKTPVLVKSSSESRMTENLASLKVVLPNEDIAKIDSIQTKCRYLDFSMFCTNGHTTDEFWDNEYFN